MGALASSEQDDVGSIETESDSDLLESETTIGNSSDQDLKGFEDRTGPVERGDVT